MKTKNEVAMERFLAGHNCAQSVLYAFGRDLGLDGETALKVATGLGVLGRARFVEAVGHAGAGSAHVGVARGV